MIAKKVLQTIEKHNLIKNGDTIVLGVSGGPDSVCLLHILHKLSEQFDAKMYAVHVNHMLRGEESKLDEDYVVSLCERLEVPLIVKRIDIKGYSHSRGISIEEAGREARYEQFELVADEVGASRIAVAHNRNDRAETVLMNILRGTGLNGLKGMDYVRGRIIRPLLDIDRKEIEDYCREHGLNPRIDSSNLESIYTRNKIRLELIPYIDNLLETNVTESILRMSDLLKDDDDFIEDKAAILYNQIVIEKTDDEVRLNAEVLRQNHAAVARRALRTAISHVKGNLKGIESCHIESVLELALAGRTGAEVHLPGGLRAGRSYDVLRVYSNNGLNGSSVKFEKLVNMPGVTEIKEMGIFIKAEILECGPNDKSRFMSAKSGDFTQFFDYEKLKTGICIRNRRNGDIFKPLKSNGTKKLKEYFIDNKIPREKRGKIPLVALGNEIVWVVGYKTSDKFAVTENTKSVLKLTYLNKLGSESSGE